jgi:hypothetical protein
VIGRDAAVNCVLGPVAFVLENIVPSSDPKIVRLATAGAEKRDRLPRPTSEMPVDVGPLLVPAKVGPISVFWFAEVGALTEVVHGK